jgi:hypothetical protein
MTRFVVDTSTVLHLASEGLEVSGDHELLAPTLLRSQTLSALTRPFIAASSPRRSRSERLERIWRIKIRLLGDPALRRRARPLGPHVWLSLTSRAGAPPAAS